MLLLLQCGVIVQRPREEAFRSWPIRLWLYCKCYNQGKLLNWMCWMSVCGPREHLHGHRASTLCAQVVSHRHQHFSALVKLNRTSEPPEQDEDGNKAGQNKLSENCEFKGICRKVTSAEGHSCEDQGRIQREILKWSIRLLQSDTSSCLESRKSTASFSSKLNSKLFKKRDTWESMKQPHSCTFHISPSKSFSKGFQHLHQWRT